MMKENLMRADMSEIKAFFTTHGEFNVPKALQKHIDVRKVEGPVSCVLITLKNLELPPDLNNEFQHLIGEKRLQNEVVERIKIEFQNCSIHRIDSKIAFGWAHTIKLDNCKIKYIRLYQQGSLRDFSMWGSCEITSMLVEKYPGTITLNGVEVLDEISFSDSCGVISIHNSQLYSVKIDSTFTCRAIIIKNIKISADSYFSIRTLRAGLRNDPIQEKVLYGIELDEYAKTSRALQDKMLIWFHREIGGHGQSIFRPITSILVINFFVLAVLMGAVSESLSDCLKNTLRSIYLVADISALDFLHKSPFSSFIDAAGQDWLSVLDQARRLLIAGLSVQFIISATKFRFKE